MFREVVGKANLAARASDTWLKKKSRVRMACCVYSPTRSPGVVSILVSDLTGFLAGCEAPQGADSTYFNFVCLGRSTTTGHNIYTLVTF